MTKPIELPSTIKESWKAISTLSNTERGFNILIMILSMAALVCSVIYFVDNIREIVHEHSDIINSIVEKNNESIKVQRQEFLQALKDLK